MKKILFLILTVLFFTTIPTFAIVVEQSVIYDLHNPMPSDEILDREKNAKFYQADREKGFYVDERFQVPEYQRIAPPNPDKIPENPHPTRTVEPFESYYDRNIKGERRHPYMTPVIPGYNRHYSNRRARSYTKQEYVDVWCDGQKNVKGIDCVSGNYAISFYAVRNWPIAVIKAPLRAKKSGKKAAIFFWIDDIGLDAHQIHDAKEWGELFNIPMFFGTIDSFIPLDWIT